MELGVADIRVELLAGENLGDTGTKNTLMQVGVHVGVFVGEILPGPPLLRHNSPHNHNQHWKSCNDNKCEPRVSDEHKHRDKYQIADFKEKVDDTVRKHVRDVVDILYHADKDFAVRPVVIIGKRKLLQVFEQILPDVIDDVLPHHRRNAGTQDVEQNRDTDGHNQQDRKQDEVRHIFVDHRNVECLFHNLRAKQGENNAQQRVDQCKDHLFLVLFNVNKAAF